MNKDWESRKIKAEHRKIIFRDLNENPKVYLGMPGLTKSDLRLGIQLAFFNPETFIIAAEETKKTYDQIDHYLDDNFQTYILERSLCDLIDFPPIDLAFLDFTGNITESVLNWLRKVLVHNISDGARIVFNVTSSYRGSQVVPQLIENYKRKYPEKLLEVQKNIRRLNFPFSISEFTAAYIMLFSEIFSEFSYKISLSHYKEEISPHRMITFVLDKMTKKEPKMKIEQKKPKQKLLYPTCKSLVDAYTNALLRPQAFAGWKRGLTEYCKRRELATGTPAKSFRNAVKAVLTKNGYNAKQIDG